MRIIARPGSTVALSGPTLALALVLGLAILPAGCAYNVYEPAPYSRPTVRYHSPHYYDYHYYPNVGVYFHIYSGRYYYRSRNKWVHGRYLPSYIYIGPRERIHLRIWADFPYRYHDTHRRRFHPYPGYRPHWERDRYERRYNLSHHHWYLRQYRR